MARPRKPIELKRLEGDTRQRGANRHEETLAASFEARRGRPELPVCLTFSPVEGEELKIAVKRQAFLNLAGGHWEYLADELDSHKMLATLDQGMLTTAALIYAQMVTAGVGGAVAQFEKLTQRYMQIADRMGLNESARAKLPKRGEERKDPAKSAMSGFLTSRRTA